MAKKKQKEYLVTVGGKVPPSVRKQVEKVAAQRRWTLSQYICFAVENQLARDSQPQPTGA
jgi:hypothetical protein